VSDFIDQLRGILSACSLTSTDRATVTSVRGDRCDVSIANERGPFLGLAEALYALHYSAPPTAGRGTSSEIAPETFLTQLRTANPVGTRYEDDWIVARFDAAGVVVARGVEQRVLPIADVVPLDAGIAPGLPVRVAGMRELVTGPFGHYVVVGRPVRDAQSGRQVRFYWNVDPDGAAIFLREIGTRLDRRRIPFRAKVPVDPRGYDRADAGVLYLGDDDVEAARDAIGAAHRALREHLRPRVPLFTRALAPGLAFGESPPTWDSFGMHRCDLIAEGLVLAEERRAGGDDARLSVVCERLTRYGFDLAAFECNPTSRYPYRLDVPAPEAA